METQVIDDDFQGSDDEIEDRGDVIAYIKLDETKYPLYKGNNYIGRYK
jgi:hypothetical protein